MEITKKVNVPIKDCSSEVKEMFSHAKSHASILYSIDYIAYTESQKAYDMLEDMGLCRHEINMYKNKCERMWMKLQNALRSIVTKDGFGVMMDMIVQSHGNIEDDITRLKITIHNIFLKHGIDKADVCSQLMTALCLCDIQKSVWEGYFDMYKKKCRVDFSYNFKFADFRQMLFFVGETFRRIYRGSDIDVTGEDAFHNAYNALTNKLVKKDFLEEAAMTAISYSDDARECFKEEIEEIEKSKRK